MCTITWTYNMYHWSLNSNSILYTRASIPAWAILAPKSIVVFFVRASEASEHLGNTDKYFCLSLKIMTMNKTRAPYLDLSISHANIAFLHHIQSLWFILLHIRIVSNLLLTLISRQFGLLCKQLCMLWMYAHSLILTMIVRYNLLRNWYRPANLSVRNTK